MDSTRSNTDKARALIFIVDDDIDDVRLTRKAFARANFDCDIEHIENGEALLSLLGSIAESEKKVLPSLVLLDLNMPIIDGRESLALIKADHRFASIPTIIFTSSSNDTDVKAAYSLGANSFVSKPDEFGGLIRVISSIKEFWFNTAALPRYV